MVTSRDTPHGESLKIAKELIKSYAEEATAPLSLRRGNTDELKLARATHSTSQGIAN